MSEPEPEPRQVRKEGESYIESHIKHSPQEGQRLTGEKASFKRPTWTRPKSEP